MIWQQERVCCRSRSRWPFCFGWMGAGTWFLWLWVEWWVHPLGAVESWFFGEDVSLFGFGCVEVVLNIMLSTHVGFMIIRNKIGTCYNSGFMVRLQLPQDATQRPRLILWREFVIFNFKPTHKKHPVLIDSQLLSLNCPTYHTPTTYTASLQASPRCGSLPAELSCDCFGR